MPCRVSYDVHEWINDPPAVPARGPVNPHNLDEQSRIFQRGEKSLWNFTASCRWDVTVGTECRWEPSMSTSLGVGGGADVTPPIHGYIPHRGIASSGTPAGGQFGWGGTPLKRYQGGPKLDSSETETRSRGQDQMSG